jgi:hypothetical protein
MGRASKKTLKGTEPTAFGHSEKYSFIAPPGLHEQIQRAAAACRDSATNVIRRCLAENLYKYQEATGGSPVPGRLSIQLSPELANALDVAARLWSLDVQNLIQYILAENVAGTVQKGRQRAAELAKIPELSPNRSGESATGS